MRRLLLAVLLFYPPALAAEQRSSILILVRNSATFAPLAEARVTLTRPGLSDTTAVTDTSGRHAFRRLRPGSYTVRASWKELVSHPATIRLADREEVEVEFTVGPRPSDTARLPELTVAVPRSRSYLQRFDERRALGIGQFLTREDIEPRIGRSLGELLRVLRGVRVSCRGGTCIPYMQRAPSGCTPIFILDDSRVEAAFAARIPGSDIEAVEVYEGLSQIPLEFMGEGRQARCGMVIIWTRRPGLRPPG